MFKNFSHIFGFIIDLIANSSECGCNLGSIPLEAFDDSSKVSVVIILEVQHKTLQRFDQVLKRYVKDVEDADDGAIDVHHIFDGSRQVFHSGAQSDNERTNRHRCFHAAHDHWHHFVPNELQCLNDYPNKPDNPPFVWIIPIVGGRRRPETETRQGRSYKINYYLNKKVQLLKIYKENPNLN